jgi:hypothetical protein
LRSTAIFAIAVLVSIASALALVLLALYDARGAAAE